MENMNCPNCALKHIAAAISYAKEIMAGHGKGADLDHRPDFLGELVNAEHHLKAINQNLFAFVVKIRRHVQDTQTTPSETIVMRLRKLWASIEKNYLDSENIPDTLINPNTMKKVTSKPCASCGKKKSGTLPTDSLSGKVTDIVIPLAEKGAHDNLELRYALRSIEKYARNYRDIIIVGNNVPSWLQNVKIISSVEDSSRKNITLFRKRLAAAMESDADYKLYWCDDYVFLKMMHVKSIPALKNGKDLLDYSGSRVWHRCLKAAGEALKTHGKTTFDCESHTPSLNERRKFIRLAEIFQKERETDPGMTVCALYHNYYGSRMLPMDKIKATFEKKVEIAEVKEKTKGRIFLGYDDKGFESGVKDFLAEKFPEKSQYEV